jgi:hypothetical protein
MEYIKIRNWGKWQTYRKDRGQPPWIKIHRQIRLNPDWVELSDGERGQLVAMWLLAADRNGEIPSSENTVKKLCFMSSKPDFNKFKRLGFIENNDVITTPSRRQDVTPEAEAEADTDIDIDKEKHLDFVFLFQEEYEKLIEKLGESKTKEMIERLNGYIGQIGPQKAKKYKSHYHTILNWNRKDGDQKSDISSGIRTCSFCGEKRPANKWSNNKCPACGEVN